MLDVICMVFAELLATEIHKKSKWNYLPPLGIESATLYFPASRSNQSAANDQLVPPSPLIVTELRHW